MEEPADGPLRRAILLRHGQTAYNAERRWQGWLDVPLDPVGLRQAEYAAELLARDGRLTRLVSSPLRRAAQTATVVAGAFDLAGRPLVRSFDERLREIDMGQWAGLTHEEVVERYPHESAALARGEVVRRGIDGETVAEATGRTREAFTDVLASLAPGDVPVFVAHGFVLRGLVADLLGMDLRQFHTLFTTLGNCRWAEVVAESDGTWRVERWNAGA